MNHELHESGEPILALCSNGFDRFFFCYFFALTTLNSVVSEPTISEKNS